MHIIGDDVGRGTNLIILSKNKQTKRKTQVKESLGMGKKPIMDRCARTVDDARRVWNDIYN
jgi:hypothetical protein